MLLNSNSLPILPSSPESLLAHCPLSSSSNTQHTVPSLNLHFCCSFCLEHASSTSLYDSFPYFCQLSAQTSPAQRTSLTPEFKIPPSVTLRSPYPALFFFVVLIAAWVIYSFLYSLSVSSTGT